MSKAPSSATDLYEAFHRYPPKKVGEFAPGFRIPPRARKQGRAIDVLYRSTKVDPETLKQPRKPVDYIHEHDPGVITCLTGSTYPKWRAQDGGAGEFVEVPGFLREANALVLLGQCLGFKFEDPDGNAIEATGDAPLPELYTTTNGRALLVVQSKREIIALMWGGRLSVEPRGIVG